MKVTVNRYSIEHGSYTYSVTLHAEQWSVVRRKTSHANIPPLMQVYTENGWEGVLSVTDSKVAFSNIEQVCAVIEKEGE